MRVCAKCTYDTNRWAENCDKKRTFLLWVFKEEHKCILFVGSLDLNEMKHYSLITVSLS